MAVYASLVSLIHVINHHQNPPPPYAFLTILQTQPLYDQVSFLLDFVENYSQTRSKEIQLLETRIAAAAHKAEDVIEGYRVEEIDLLKSGETVDEEYAKACEDLEKVVQEMDLITKDVLKIKADSKKKNQKLSIEVAAHSSSSSSSINNVIAKAGGKSTMVGFDDDLINLKEKLTTHQSDRLVVPIVGMGGIGKTTLATNTYNDPFIKSYFDIRAWVTISQDYSFRKFILDLLHDTGLFSESLEASSNKSDGELGEKLHKALFGRKYLIVLDDIWSITAWDEISKFLPDNGNGSRIIMTTRLSILALSLGSLNHYHEMKFLDDVVSWNLLSEKVFGQGEQAVCPPELEKFGQIIAKNCRGLPLAIVVIGGLLKVSEKTPEYWSEVAENVSSIVNKENDELCLRILSLSYNQLPIQLKPLFLYMAIFPEDSKVIVSSLIKLWVAEGFLKPPPPNIINKTLEEVAEKYFNDLIDRNLIMVQERGFRGNIETCKIHDLLRDLCLREAHKEKFLCIGNMNEDVTENINGKRRLGIHSNTRFRYNEFSTMLEDLQLMSFARTVVMQNRAITPDIIFCYSLLRVLHGNDQRYRLHDILHLHNSRYLEFVLEYRPLGSFPFDKIPRYLEFVLEYRPPGSFPFDKIPFLPWNLETLIVKGLGIPSKNITLPSEIWEMQHLRHIEFQDGVYLSNPDGENYCVLNNLQTLSHVGNFMFSDEILGRIPNLKKLTFGCEQTFFEKYVTEKEEETHIHYNLVRLQKLEILDCHLRSDCNIDFSLNFPPTLRKMSLSGTRIPWENINIVGSLPNLEVLVLGDDAFCGPEWNSTEGEFQCLKSLRIIACDLRIWRADSVNFPALKHLVLQSSNLEEIPWGIGEIPSLELIKLVYCNRSVVISAKEIHLDAQAQGNDDFLIEVFSRDDDIRSLESHNFKVMKW